MESSSQPWRTTGTPPSTAFWYLQGGEGRGAGRGSLGWVSWAQVAACFYKCHSSGAILVLRHSPLRSGNSWRHLSPLLLLLLACLLLCCLPHRLLPAAARERSSRAAGCPGLRRFA